MHIGEGKVIWQFSIVLASVTIGRNCNINCHTFIENEVQIGNEVTIKAGVYLWDGISIEDHVFIGPNVTFTNDPFPRSKQYPEKFQQTRIQIGAAIGANATILGGINIGKFALIGAGSVVTKSVPDFAMVVGNPAKITGWVDELGNKLEETNGGWENKAGDKFKVVDQQLKAD
jgi:acetyltransferase-like isoleucine patch superfamily enzyme